MEGLPPSVCAHHSPHAPPRDPPNKLPPRHARRTKADPIGRINLLLPFLSLASLDRLADQLQAEIDRQSRPYPRLAPPGK